MPEGRDLDLRYVQYSTIGIRSSLPHDDLGREERRGRRRESAFCGVLECVCVKVCVPAICGIAHGWLSPCQTRRHHTERVCVLQARVVSRRAPAVVSPWLRSASVDLLSLWRAYKYESLYGCRTHPGNRVPAKSRRRLLRRALTSCEDASGPSVSATVLAYPQRTQAQTKVLKRGPLGASKHSWCCGVDPTESNGAPAREVTGIRDQSGGMASWAVDKQKQLRPSSRRILFVRPDKWTGEMDPNWPPCCCIRLLWPWRADAGSQNVLFVRC
ncbi:hypothetical protein HDV62DRAFT_330017 [Trichoderma sp. SZMC 28011]